MNVFYAPAAFDEFYRQPVEQFGMGRALASRAEILGRRYQSLSEILLPYAVDNDARGQRIVPVNDPFRQAEPVRRSVFRERVQRGGNARADGIAGTLPVAAFEDARLARDLPGADSQRRRTVWPSPR